MKAERTPKPNEIYRHFKGDLYRVITLAQHTETEETLVIYQALYGDFKIYARPLCLFMGEVDRQKHPESAGEYRFTLVREIFGQGTEAMGDMLRDPQRDEGAGDDPHQPQSPDPCTGEASMEGTEEVEESPSPAPVKEDGVPERTADAKTQDAKGREDDEEGFTLDPMLLEFLEADSYEEKLNILVGMHGRLTQDMLNTAAVSLDIELEEGEMEERYQTLKECLLTLEKYECTRLR